MQGAGSGGYSYKSALILSQYRIDDGKKNRDVST